MNLSFCEIDGCSSHFVQRVNQITVPDPGLVGLDFYLGKETRLSVAVVRADQIDPKVGVGANVRVHLNTQGAALYVNVA